MARLARMTPEESQEIFEVLYGSGVRRAGKRVETGRPWSV